MKTIFVMLLLSISMFTLIIFLDLALGFSPHGIIRKQLRSFRVTEQTELVILILFALYFVIKGISGFIKKKQQENAQ
ncbi:hypothetical protein [Neobacillus mesonae]|uniref:Uncharacterized protein n=1 Tax=Neobacillus mesonae TaxID=1193713 RepID=A0A3Q9QUF3_9BACI|nr:hypothetical protein [Neobacillus mesonae]AZU61817.1 hypothetical protein CHR53_11290 [Neobacillus mesonae]